jgi:hypothetical protein
MKTLPAMPVHAFSAAAVLAVACVHCVFAQTLQTSRFVAPPVLTRLPTGGAEWSAAVDCNPPVSPASLIGVRVVFSLDFDLDGIADAADSLGVSPADCGEVEPGRILLRRVFRQPHPALLRADLRTPSGSIAASHFALTSGKGSLLAIARYCARPKNGEPEWIEVRNNTVFTVPLTKVRLEARVLSGTLNPGEGFTAGSDTAELRLWQPGARLVALSSWSNLRNTGDTIRISFTGADGNLVIDSVIYPSASSGGAGAGAFPGEDCASLASEGAGGAAHGYELELPSARWRRGGEPFVLNVRAPVDGRFDLRVYDLDGAEQCAIARNAIGPAALSLPHPACAGLEGRAGRFVLQLQPRAAPGFRKVFRITE